MKKAFTLLEIVFVIVILGILAAVAVPKLSATRDDAEIAKARTVVASVRSGIALQKSARMLRGEPTRFPPANEFDNTDDQLFYLNDGNRSNILETPVFQKKASSNRGWSRIQDNQYQFDLASKNTVFTYNPDNGTFNCPASDELCTALTH